MIGVLSRVPPVLQAIVATTFTWGVTALALMVGFAGMMTLDLALG